MSLRCLALATVLLAACGDNIVPGDSMNLVINAEDNLTTTEGGGTATFTVQLREAPASAVTIDVTSSDVSEGTVSPATVTLDANNFNVPVTITITGVEDDADDGDQAYQVTLSATDAAGGGPATATVDVTNQDNDGVGITVEPTSGLTTNEDGTSATFMVVLDAQPTADVVVPLSSSDPGEGVAEQAMLTFTTENWNAPQIVTVSGVDDSIADGPQTYTIQLGAATSTDPAYSGLDANDVELTNVDNDSPGVIVNPTSGLQTTESGGTATFTVVLASEPSADVTITLASSDAGEGTVAPTTLTFTPANWDAEQVVTVTGVDDGLDDGDQSYTIVLAAATSTDAGYNGIDPDDVSVTNIDDEAPGYSIVPLTGLSTTEGGGTATFTVALVSAPTADVTIAISAGNPDEATPNQTSLTFTPADFATPQTVTVTGVDDAIADGAQPFTIVLAPAVSADPAYDGLDPQDVTGTNTDDDSPGITVFPNAGLLVSELGDTATFTIVLNSEPTGNVTIGLSSNDTTEGTVSPASVTFTPLNWDVPRTITITGVNDAIADGNQQFFIITAAALSTDPTYNGLNPSNVKVTNFDDDIAAVLVSSDGIEEVSENGTTATYSMVLTTQPTSNVRCAVTSTDTSEGTVNVTSVLFTPTDYDQPHVVTITGVDDAIVDGVQLFTIVNAACNSLDPSYANLNPRDVNARNLDND
ncbi:MAG TPA: Calx-beta domain-containing protein [Kofleriaceae bacterium]|nr:Calx-beta domain-containing protein [Kofleriaceae bacterium]